MAANDNARADARHVQGNVGECLQLDIVGQLHCVLARPNHVMPHEICQSSGIRLGEQYAIEQKSRAFISHSPIRGDEDYEGSWLLQYLV